MPPKDEILQLQRLDAHRWRIDPDQRPGMLVPGIVYSSDALIEAVAGDASLGQVANVANLPGIVSASLAMPDIHWGYGFPIGGVAAFDVDQGVISPGGVGYDINCGISLLRTDLDAEELRRVGEKLADRLFADIPAGMGEGGDLRLTREQLRRVAEQGAGWLVGQGLADAADLERMEEGGRLDSADPDAISDRACDRGRDQLGTLGSGNHFLEVQEVEEIYDEPAAAAMGLRRGQILVMIHSGSRGFGYQVCTEQLKSIGSAPARYGIELPDRQLACAPINSDEGRAYAGAMAGAANYAWANRLALAGRVRRSFELVFGKGYSALGMGLVFDITHNIAKFETHRVEGRERQLCVHRKGATRAFGPGDERVPAPYREIGQPVLIPGDMGTASHVLVGSSGAMEQTFGSACHGAGRLLGRRAALRATRGRDIESELAGNRILVRAHSHKTLGEEVSEAYKDVDAVVEAAEGAGLARRAVRLKPIIVIKG